MTLAAQVLNDAASTDVSDWLSNITIGQALAALLPILGILAFLIRIGWRTWTQTIRPATAKFRDFLDDWNGVADRPGVEGRHGVMARLEHQKDHLSEVQQSLNVLSHEVKPNGGGSLRDAVDRVEEALREHIELSTEDRRGLHQQIDNLTGASNRDRQSLHTAVDALSTETDAHHDHPHD